MNDVQTVERLTGIAEGFRRARDILRVASYDAHDIAVAHNDGDTAEAINMLRDLAAQSLENAEECAIRSAGIAEQDKNLTTSEYERRHSQRDG